jgi:hypothetical protein
MAETTYADDENRVNSVLALRHWLNPCSLGGQRGVPMATTIGKFSIWSTIAVLAIVIIALALTLAR